MRFLRFFSLGFQLLFVSRFVDFLGSKASLRYVCHIPFREAVIKSVKSADAYNVANLVPVILGVEGIGGKRLLLIVELSVTAVKDKSILIVSESALADTIESLRVNNHHNINRGVKLIAAVLNLFFHALSLPVKPVGNVVESSVSLASFKRALFVKLIGLAALGTAESSTLSEHFVFF